jgi:chromate reductase, NAD(P)H dehydrogenase (quinone)
MTKIKILAIPGSLRTNSSSNAIMYSVISMAPENVEITVYNGLAQLPHFDDSDPAPTAVTDFRSQLQKADGILICTPEYAFGVPGSLKNALDWTVSSCDFVDKPVALITASSGGEHGHASLLLILKAISAKIVGGAALLVPFVRTKVNKEGTITDPALKENLRNVLISLVKTVDSK